MEFEASNREALESLRAFAASEAGLGARVAEARPVQPGTQVVVTNGKDRVPVTLYHSGTIVMQGPGSGLRLALERWRQARSPHP